MTEACLTCSEIELKICELSDAVTSAGCGGLIVKEGDTTFDHSPELEAKVEALKVWRDFYKMRCQGSGELYEFVSVPCVRPYDCVGSSCATTGSPAQNRRRYRR